MNLQELQSIVDQLSVYLNKTMKPYNLPVKQVQIVPDNEDEFRLFILNQKVLNKSPKELLKTYKDLTVVVIFNEIDDLDGVGLQWCHYRQFIIENNITLIKNFLKLSNEERESMFQNRTDTTFEIHRDILSFGNIETIIPNPEKPFEVPPLFFDEEMYHNLISNTSVDEKGSWMRTMIRTYMSGGKIFYKKINEDYFEVQIKF